LDRTDIKLKSQCTAQEEEGVEGLMADKSICNAVLSPNLVRIIENTEGAIWWS